ncbi:hypothetical protein A9Q84_06720 [Halobacteriovorax marinus]|uniref:PhoU domain-containing protein n=1 Tax=Halobacteriovorax marinus TaxID=97084 RepID=A0A1Y5FDU5_9BACT|nr:hypothetical protein A9Q84_06720 [Halobacteriovorax marinus]
MWPILGGIALFIFSINFLVLSMQALSGELLRGINAKTEITAKNSLLVGLLSGASVLSVSSCTNLIVGLVNSGIVSFYISALYIMGVNLGASVFPWLLTFDLGNWSYLLLFIGSIGHYFIRNLFVKLFSRVILGIGFLYLGLNLSIIFFSSDSLLNIESLQQASFFFLVLALLSGFIVSYLLNSTAILIGLFMAFFYTHNISVELSCAVLVGATLGPSLRLYFNSKRGNIEGQRAALFNIILNSISIPVALIFLHFFSSYFLVIEELVGTQFVLPIFYSGINLINVFISFLFFKFIRKAILRLIRSPEVKIPQKLIFFGAANQMVPATSLWQAHREMKKMKSLVDKMFSRASIYMHAIEGSSRDLAKIKKYEDITDNINDEMKYFIHGLLENSLNPAQTKECTSLLNVASEFENIADYINKFVTHKTKLVHAHKLSQDKLTSINKLFAEVNVFYETCCENLGTTPPATTIAGQRKVSQKLKENCESLRFSLESEDLLYSDMIIGLRKIRSHSFNLFMLR